MAFKILPATLADTDELGRMVLSVSTSARITLEFKDCRREDFLDWNTKAVEVEIGACLESNVEAEALKVVDEESGEIVGYAVWGWSEKAISRVLRVKETLPLPPGCNTNLRETYLSLLNDMEAKHQPKEPFYELLELATHPSYQRRGIGSQLVNYGLEKAERDGKKVYLSAAPKGVPVYAKLGFGEVGRLEFALGKWGGEGVHVHVAMIKEFGSGKGL
ncbi:acyl-CoA N-acyltransferase [Acephala macrosclerotiorum]|nr:acyl-CoA N-acyltransferase [Acephala macrosclerotiorum]